MTGMVRRDAIKRDLVPAVELTAEELVALADAAEKGGRGWWISRTEQAAIESIIAARLDGAR